MEIQSYKDKVGYLEGCSFYTGSGPVEQLMAAMLYVTAAGRTYCAE